MSRMDVLVYGPLRAATDGKRVTVSPAEHTVDGIITALREQYPRAESQLVDEGGRLRASVRVTVDGETAEGDDACPPDAEVRVFPAMRGG